jgi:hypothetical protein
MSKTFGAFASKNTALDIKEQSKAEVEAAAELQGQRSEHTLATLGELETGYPSLRTLYACFVVCGIAAPWKATHDAQLA